MHFAEDAHLPVISRPASPEFPSVVPAAHLVELLGVKHVKPRVLIVSAYGIWLFHVCSLLLVVEALAGAKSVRDHLSAPGTAAGAGLGLTSLRPP